MLISDDRTVDVNVRDMVIFFWRILSSLLPMSGDNCTARVAQLFDTAVFVFRALGEVAPDEFNMNRYVRDWGRTLVEHHREEVGH